MLNLAELNHLTRLELVQWYFLKGFSYKEMFLSNQLGIDISLRQLHRLLHQQYLYRRHHKDTVNVVLEAMKADIDGPSTNLGYRSIHQKLIHNGIKTDRETVRPCLKTINPEGVERRKSHKLKRRVYVSQEPNFMWHVHGYDKVKPFGFPIHGAIDGFSRKILWLNICPSNNDPHIVRYFYVNCISNLKYVPRTIRGDRGSENVVVAGMRYFRGEHPSRLHVWTFKFFIQKPCKQSANRIVVVSFEKTKQRLVD